MPRERAWTADMPGFGCLQLEAALTTVQAPTKPSHHQRALRGQQPWQLLLTTQLDRIAVSSAQMPWFSVYMKYCKVPGRDGRSTSKGSCRQGEQGERGVLFYRISEESCYTLGPGRGCNGEGEVAARLQRAWPEAVITI